VSAHQRETTHTDHAAELAQSLPADRAAQLQLLAGQEEYLPRLDRAWLVEEGR